MPLLKLESRGSVTIVLSDLHLGLGGTNRRAGGPPEGSAETMARSLIETARRERAGRVVIAGDVKHPIVGTPAPLRPVVFRFFATLLAEGFGVEVVLGNHDVGLVAHLPREVVVHPPTGTVVDGVGIFHGHRWPSPEVLGAHRWVVGHLHPGYRFAPTVDAPSGKQRCWVRVRYSTTPPRAERRGRTARANELVVLPAYNPLTGTEALNHDRPRRGRSFLFARFILPGEPRAYLLDGTDLGPLPTTRAGSPPLPKRSAAGRGP